MTIPIKAGVCPKSSVRVRNCHALRGELSSLALAGWLASKLAAGGRVLFDFTIMELWVVAKPEWLEDRRSSCRR